MTQSNQYTPLVTPPPSSEYIASLTLHDPAVVKRRVEVEQERQVVTGDLLRENSFAPCEVTAGPYDVILSIEDNRLLFAITSDTLGDDAHMIKLPVAAFRRIIKDYFMICESYFDALGTADPYKLEAMDMGRRGVHNEGSELLKKLLAPQVTIDFDTARRLFTLMCVLHIR